MQVCTVETPELGDRSYLVHDGSVGVVVDPQRDLDRIEAEIADAGVRVTHVLETHLHNDYVTGGLELARRTGAEYVVASGDELGYAYRPVTDGDVIETGALRVGVVGTPGHTVNHVSYVVQQDGDPPVAFTGGNLLYGSVGRTDLVDPGLTEELTRRQYRSARRLAGMLPDETRVMPTHGFGSFCSSGPATAKDVSTLADEKQVNDALTTEDEDRFVESLMAGLAAYPRYYAHMGPMNKRGAGAADLSPVERVDRDELRRRLQAGEWVVDLRDRRAYAARHLSRSLSFELSQQFTTYFGWVLPWGDAVTLVGDTPEQVAKAQRDLARIGIDKGTIRGAAVDPLSGSEDGEVRSFPSVDWPELAEAFSDGARPVVLDVRREDEYASAHIEGAVNVPIHDLLGRLGEVPGDGRLWIHCGSGYRSAIAASILEREGHDVVHIDGDWDPEQVEKAGLPVVS